MRHFLNLGRNRLQFSQPPQSQSISALSSLRTTSTEADDVTSNTSELDKNLLLKQICNDAECAIKKRDFDKLIHEQAALNSRLLQIKVTLELNFSDLCTGDNTFRDPNASVDDLLAEREFYRRCLLRVRDRLEAEFKGTDKLKRSEALLDVIRRSREYHNRLFRLDRTEIERALALWNHAKEILREHFARQTIDVSEALSLFMSFEEEEEKEENEEEFQSQTSTSHRKTGRTRHSKVTQLRWIRSFNPDDFKSPDADLFYRICLEECERNERIEREGMHF